MDDAPSLDTQLAHAKTVNRILVRTLAERDQEIAALRAELKRATRPVALAQPRPPVNAIARAADDSYGGKRGLT